LREKAHGRSEGQALHGNDSFDYCDAHSVTELGQKRRFDRPPVTSGLHPMNGHILSRSACLKRANSDISQHRPANRGVLSNDAVGVTPPMAINILARAGDHVSRC